MEFTGERVVPGKVEHDLLNEHLSRYYFARQLAQGRHVLDLGCGTGYGSALLAEAADQVIGLDISAESVAYARKNYGRSKLDFLISDCRSLPLAAACVDAVVCLEVVEHVSEQEELLKEIVRVLRPDGIAVISTPNRIYYTDERQEVNPFHVREFDFEEFSACLKNCFSHVEIAFQNHVSSLYIADRQSTGPTQSQVEPGPQDLERTSHYFVGVCSNSTLPDRGSLIYLPATGNQLRQKERHILALESREQELNSKVLDQQKEYDAQSQWCQELNRQMQERTEWAQRLQQRIEELDQHITELHKQRQELEEELQRRADWAGRLNEEIASRDQRILGLQAEFEERAAWAARLSEELKVSAEKLEQIKRSKLFQMSRALGLLPKV